MSREKLVALIHAHAQNPGNEFNPESAEELAPGVIIVRYNGQEHCIFHDRDTLFVCMARAVEGPAEMSWENIAASARHYLQRHDLKPITWHDTPVPLEL